MSFTQSGAATSSLVAASPPADQPAVSVQNVTKKFTRRGKQSAENASITPVNDVSFDVGQGEFVVLVGPSGCGKTTLLRCVAGLERPDAGTIDIGATTVFSSDRGTFVPANRRPVSMMFQSYALWPHMTVFENVAYPLKIQGIRGAALKERVMSILAIVGLGRLAEQHPAHISGGEQQRVAVARALAVEAGVVLFDEPLSNVDAKVREQLRVDLMRVHREIGFAALYVTHDQGEALELADRIAVLNSGEVEQFGRPSDVYHHPASVYVADFLGSANIIDATVTGIKGDVIEARTDTDLPIVGRAANRPGIAKGTRVGAMFRPEHTTVTGHAPAAEKGTNWFPARLIADLFQGAHVEYVAMHGETRLRAWDTRGSVTPTDSEVHFGVRDENVQMLPLSRHGWEG